MPIYEFRCNACGHEFEKLVLPWLEGSSDKPKCASCQCEDVERMLSLFAVDSEGTRKTHLADGRKHATKEHKEKQDAEYKMMIEHAKEH